MRSFRENKIERKQTSVLGRHVWATRNQDTDLEEIFDERIEVLLPGL